MKCNPSTEIKHLGGVGKVREEKLYKLGIKTVRDLLYHFPRSYEDRGNISPLKDADTEHYSGYLLTVASTPTSVKLQNHLTMTKFRAFDESGSCEVVYFNSPFVKDVFVVGGEYRFYGKLNRNKNGRLTLTNPKYDIYVEGIELEDYVPVYPLTEGVTSKLLDKLIKNCIDDVVPVMEDPLPEEIRLGNNLCSLGYAIKNIHYPADINSLRIASKRLAFDELLGFALNVTLQRNEKSKTLGVSFAPCSLSPFVERLPYELTDSQKNAINDIYKDTVLNKSSGAPTAMARIVVGDVGCGKTVVAFASAYIAHKSGFQTAMMVPTEILATQHYEDMVKILEPLGMKCALLTGSLTASQKKRIYQGLSDGTINAVVGTHALLSDKITFNSLGLIITDEQHRFGVNQRGALKEREQSVHVLVMSATPIPRSLALALYGDLDISRITDMPKGRKRVDTFVVNEGYRDRLNGFILGQVKDGGQAYVVCPSIESDEEDEDNLYFDSSEDGINLLKKSDFQLKNAVQHAEELKRALPSVRIGVLHGKMKNSEKDKIMSEFVNKNLDVLVSTTVIEVGVNVPNASLMIVENAERFGLSQLHQLRGRVGRGERKSYCVLVSDNDGKKSRERLEIMRTTYDGYEIAEKDLLMRGPGDFFSANHGSNLRQSGGFEFRFASSCQDSSLLEGAFSSAKSILKTDPDLSLDKHKLLKELLRLDYLKQSDIS